MYILTTSSQIKIENISNMTEFLSIYIPLLGFPDGSDGKESACNGGDLGSIPGSGRSLGGGHGTKKWKEQEAARNLGLWK